MLMVMRRTMISVVMETRFRTVSVTSKTSPVVLFVVILVVSC